MKRKNLLTLGLTFMLVCMPMFTGCEQRMEDFIIAALSGFQKAPEPSIREGKFDFSVTYEVGGGVKTISGVYVCKFKEAGQWLDGPYIEWEGYIENQEIATLPPEYNENLIIVETNDDGTIYLDLMLQPGYFMSEPSWKDRTIKPYVYIKYNDIAKEEKGTYGSEDIAVLESYGVKIVSYDYASPIENIYK